MSKSDEFFFRVVIPMALLVLFDRLTDGRFAGAGIRALGDLLLWLNLEIKGALT